MLFGLGFDTATEVGLLVLAGGAAAFNLPLYAILVLPVLFAAGMSLMDTADGVFMNAAYGWAFAKPVRKVFYNLTITALSVAVALIIGVLELIGVLAERPTSTRARWPGSPRGPRLRRLRHRRPVRRRLARRARRLAVGPHRGEMVRAHGGRPGLDVLPSPVGPAPPRPAARDRWRRCPECPEFRASYTSTS